MSKVNMTIKCVICENDNKLNIVKPSAFQPTIVKTDCEKCKTRFMYRLIHKTGKQREVRIETKVLSVTDEVREMIKEKEIERKAKAAEKAKTAIANLNDPKEQML